MSDVLHCRSVPWLEGAGAKSIMSRYALNPGIMHGARDWCLFLVSRQDHVCLRTSAWATMFHLVAQTCPVLLPSGPDCTFVFAIARIQSLGSRLLVEIRSAPNPSTAFAMVLAPASMTSACAFVQQVCLCAW